MTSGDGRFVLTFNGEIYNFPELASRLRLAGVTFRGRSDSEVLVEGFARWGVIETLRQVEGMFALATWDRRDRVLLLARDRLGIKPLYWSQQPGLFLFASELKALHRHPHWSPPIDREALAAFLRFGCVPAPRSIYLDTYKLQPGMLLTVSRLGDVQQQAYWRLADIAEKQNGARQREQSIGERLDGLEAVLRRAIRDEMISDVPVGAFLSGGVDSSLVVALMQEQNARRIRTFTVGFAELDYDEAPYARRIAAHLGTEHTELYVDEREALSAIPDLPNWYDEPFADSSQIPTQLISRLARQSVTVALSGDGGDELFGGYERYIWARRIAILQASLPLPMRRSAARLVSAAPAPLFETVAARLPRRFRRPMLAQRLPKLASAIAADGSASLYRNIVSLWPDSSRLVPGAVEEDNLADKVAVGDRLGDPLEAMMFLDQLTYLPDDILTKVDRASMSVSLEVRVPLLNKKVVEAAWGLPIDLKVRGATSKWALRQILYRHVPAELIERPKQGFAVPLGRWLRGPLREWAESLLNPAMLGRSGLLEPEPFIARWREHCSGRKDWSQSLWAVLMYQAWSGHRS